MMPERRPLRYGILTLVAAWALLCGTPAPRTISHELSGTARRTRVLDARDRVLGAQRLLPVRQPRLERDGVPARHPDAAADARPASAYVGVGPDQNFTYIAALKPRIAFIVDIRRQNMLLHLMYKALIEMSPTREEFLSRLFSRPMPGAAAPRRLGATRC